jgi:hypothetical protein
MEQIKIATWNKSEISNFNGQRTPQIQRDFIPDKRFSTPPNNSIGQLRRQVRINTQLDQSPLAYDPNLFLNSPNSSRGKRKMFDYGSRDSPNEVPRVKKSKARF